jgi:hypothetical protein
MMLNLQALNQSGPISTDTSQTASIGPVLLQLMITELHSTSQPQTIVLRSLLHYGIRWSSLLTLRVDQEIFFLQYHATISNTGDTRSTSTK